MNKPKLQIGFDIDTQVTQYTHFCFNDKAACGSDDLWFIGGLVEDLLNKDCRWWNICGDCLDHPQVQKSIIEILKFNCLK